MADRTLPPGTSEIVEIARQTPGLELLLLFGSRARGDGHSGSDWDFGFLAEKGFDVDGLFTRILLALRTDRVDLVDLSRAGGLLRYRAAAEGLLVYEARQNAFEEFWFQAVSYWCDMGPIIREAYEGNLERLSR